MIETGRTIWPGILVNRTEMVLLRYPYGLASPYK